MYPRRESRTAILRHAVNAALPMKAKASSRWVRAIASIAARSILSSQPVPKSPIVSADFGDLPVSPSPKGENVGAVAAGQHIASRAADQRVAPVAAVDPVAAAAAHQRIAAVEPAQHVGLVAAGDDIVRRVAVRGWAFPASVRFSILAPSVKSILAITVSVPRPRSSLIVSPVLSTT